VIEMQFSLDVRERWRKIRDTVKRRREHAQNDT
jgi:hypothetical protein